MNQKFLDSLVGLSVNKAERLAKKQKYDCWTIDNKTRAIPSIAYHKTILLFEENGIVKAAEIGDPFELTKVL